jgi:hypothetical protein
MERAAQTRTITVPIANYDDNQHAANKNLRLQNLCDGVETMAALLQMKQHRNARYNNGISISDSTISELQPPGAFPGTIR